MADVQFSEEQFYERPVAPAASPPLIALVMRLGLAKQRQQAEYILIGVAVAAIVLTIAVWLFSGTSSDAAVPGPLEQALVPGQRQYTPPSR